MSARRAPPHSRSRSRLETVLLVGEAHRRQTPTGNLEMEDLNDDALFLLLDTIANDNAKDACRAMARFCSLNKRHHNLCSQSGDAVWNEHIARIFGPGAPTADSENAFKNFYALCKRAVDYSRGCRNIQDHPEDRVVDQFRYQFYHYQAKRVEELLYMLDAWVLTANFDKFGHNENRPEDKDKLAYYQYFKRGSLLLEEFIDRFAGIARTRTVADFRNKPLLDAWKPLVSKFYYLLLVYSNRRGRVLNTGYWEYALLDEDNENWNKDLLWRLQELYESGLPPAMAAISGYQKTSYVGIGSFFYERVRRDVDKGLYSFPTDIDHIKEALDEAMDIYYDETSNDEYENSDLSEWVEPRAPEQDHDGSFCEWIEFHEGPYPWADA